MDELQDQLINSFNSEVTSFQISFTCHRNPCHESSQMKQNYLLSLLLFVAVLVLLNFFFQLHISIFGSIMLTIVVNLVFNLVFNRRP